MLARAVAKKRISDGLSLRALSEKIGVSFSTLSRIENGSHSPDPNTILRVSNWLGAQTPISKKQGERHSWVHFRAAKNASSRTVSCLFAAAQNIQREHHSSIPSFDEHYDDIFNGIDRKFVRSKVELEALSSRLRQDLGLDLEEPFDALSLKVDGIEKIFATQMSHLASTCYTVLDHPLCSEWSAMSVPISIEDGRWVILLNDTHSVVRQRVTYLEEFWHIMLGHKLTKIAKVGDAFARTFEKQEEDEAFFLAASTLLPRRSIDRFLRRFTQRQISVQDYAENMQVSVPLVEFRIKRLGLWKEYRGFRIHMES